MILTMGETSGPQKRESHPIVVLISFEEKNTVPPFEIIISKYFT